MVKKGGRLVYATCSLLPEENEKQIESFLKEHTDFKLLPARELVDVHGFGDYLRMTPPRMTRRVFRGRAGARGTA